MSTRPYLVCIVLAIGIVVSGCDGLQGQRQQSRATEPPFNRFDAEDILSAFILAELSADNAQLREGLIGRGAPNTHRERYTFEIARIAPEGGQILIFDNRGDLQVWEAYIESLRASSETRRDVVYVYTNGNVMLQLNTNLTPAEAHAYRDVFEWIGVPPTPTTAPPTTAAPTEG